MIVMLHSAVPTPSSIYVFDLDGVMYLGDTPIPYATEAVQRVSGAGKTAYFLTNNSGRTRQSYQEKLRAVNGLEAPIERIFTSAYATALYLHQPGALRHTAFVIGESGLAQEIEEVGNLNVVTIPDSVSPSDIDYVIVGIDRQFSYDKLRFAHAAIMRGRAEFIATNRDATFPTEVGEIPGGGSLVAALATCTGREPTTIGKPEPHALEAILRSAGVSAAECTIVGDRLDTDIAVGKRVGGHTVLVLTGVTSRETAEAAPDAWRPDEIIGDLRELI
jgi:phosphoglycolate/pyridoxal phosphate phosphatase family enzyme